MILDIRLDSAFRSFQKLNSSFNTFTPLIHSRHNFLPRAKGESGRVDRELTPLKKKKEYKKYEQENNHSRYDPLDFSTSASVFISDGTWCQRVTTRGKWELSVYTIVCVRKFAERHETDKQIYSWSAVVKRHYLNLGAVTNAATRGCVCLCG